MKEPEKQEIGAVLPVNIEEEMKTSYLDYAMSVIVSRALPDVRDGLKPVQRRILYAMNDLGLQRRSPYKKSARIVGEVLGKYHPHGDSSVYEAMVRMAQPFSLRNPLVEGQGNFGSVDNDPPAAMRYTEARLAAVAQEMLVDIEKETVNFVPNFDESLQEPAVLPARLPNLLVNGASGIAVGMATTIPPHNLGEVCDAIACLIENPDASTEELMRFVQGPDFPTAGIIMGREGIKNAYVSGKGKVVVRAKVETIPLKGDRQQQLVITELPYEVNKAALVERIAELARSRKIEGILEVRDESDRRGMRVVIELKKAAQPQHILNNLFKYTSMQSSFHINMVALVDGQPKLINLREALGCYIDFRREIITRRSRFDLNKARDRAHILEGLRVALDNMDRIIKLIRESETVDTARANLIAVFELSYLQSQAILDMQLRRLAHLEREKIMEEYAEVLKSISYFEDLLAYPQKILFLTKQDVLALKSQYADPRRTVVLAEEATEFCREDLVPHQTVVVTLTEQGFIKRLPISTYRLQHRGGKGVMGMVTRQADMLQKVLVADTHDSLFFFTASGKVYTLKCYEVPEEVSRTAKGVALVNLLSVDLKDQVTALVSVREISSDRFLLMATEAGLVKKTPLDKFASIRRSGLVAMGLRPGDRLVVSRIVSDLEEVVMVSQAGQAVRFGVKDMRSASRTSGGVRGIRLGREDKVAGVDVVFDEAYALLVTDNGYGKLTPIKNYPLHRRGGKGVRAYRVNDKTGGLISFKLVMPAGSLVLLSGKGKVNCIRLEQIAKQSRNSSGVRVMSMDEGDRVVSIAAPEQEVGQEGGESLL